MVADVPAVAFGQELIHAYPEAKVILNRREKEAWFKSYSVTLASGEAHNEFSTWDHMDHWAPEYLIFGVFWLRKMLTLSPGRRYNGNFSKYGLEG